MREEHNILAAQTSQGRPRAWFTEAVVPLVGGGGDAGLTVKELRTALKIHHGAASGTLSRLHRNGEIARLSQTRNGNKIYVLPHHVAGRKTEAQGRGTA